MQLDVICSQSQYWDHLIAVYLGMPPHLRGKVHIPTSRGLDKILTKHGVPWTTDRAGPSENPILSASGNDLAYVKGRPVILTEHGAGQRYSGWDDPAYAGGPDREKVTLFLHPRDETASRDAARYPDAHVAVVGCPKLDRYVRQVKARPKRPVIAFAWHWDVTKGPPEARSAWDHYGREMLANVAQWWDVDNLLGHSHPRSWRQSGDYRTVGIRLAPSFDQVIEEADVLLVDNSSTAYEFAACDRPVVLLNAPWYRRDVEHGLRFWEAADIGPQVDGPDQILDAITDAWTSPTLDARRRERIPNVYSHIGKATQAAVEAITTTFDF